MLWAWEEPEDVRSLDIRSAGVAFLAERIFLGTEARFLPRHQRIAVPDNIYAEAVVRIETRPGFRDTESLRNQTTRELLRIATLPRIRGLQVDFDATQSEQPFYADVLRRLHAALPPNISLSMTALVSWCSQPNGWLHNLPVDSAVPMYFRLGKHTGTWNVREPLCANDLGISTDEPTTPVSPLKAQPAASFMAQSYRAMSGIRTYIFAPHPWTSDQLAQINRNQIPVDTKGGK